MKKRTIIGIIISLAAIIIIAVAATVIFALVFHKSTANTTPQPPKPGDSVALSKTPSYKACSILSVDAIKSALGSDVSNLSDGDRAGIVGLNGLPAEECNYTMTIGQSKDTLSIQVYDYSVQAKGTTAQYSENPDLTWSNISYVKYPGDYLPTYYKQVDTTDGQSVAFYLRVINGAKNYLYTITQPKDAITFQNVDALTPLENLAISADYGVTTVQDAPPAPVVTN